tara:strand:+ start:8255 stop:8506 length:252 start_codon:yes stop_codon:yes gene_type:complete
MEWKYIPQEYPSINLIQHAPDNSRRPLGDSSANCWSLSRKVPTPGVPVDMNIISQRKPGATPTAVSQVSTNPNCIDGFTCCTF